MNLLQTQVLQGGEGKPKLQDNEECTKDWQCKTHSECRMAADGSDSLKKCRPGEGAPALKYKGEVCIADNECHKAFTCRGKPGELKRCAPGLLKGLKDNEECKKNWQCATHSECRVAADGSGLKKCRAGEGAPELKFAGEVCLEDKECHIAFACRGNPGELKRCQPTLNDGSKGSLCAENKDCIAASLECRAATGQPKRCLPTLNDGSQGSLCQESKDCLAASLECRAATGQPKRCLPTVNNGFKGSLCQATTDCQASLECRAATGQPKRCQPTLNHGFKGSLCQATTDCQGALECRAATGQPKRCQPTLNDGSKGSLCQESTDCNAASLECRAAAGQPKRCQPTLNNGFQGSLCSEQADCNKAFECRGLPGAPKRCQPPR